MRNALRLFTSTAEGRNIAREELREAERALERARSELSDLQDSRAHGNATERAMARERIQTSITRLEHSVSTLTSVLSEAANTVRPTQSANF